MPRSFIPLLVAVSLGLARTAIASQPEPEGVPGFGVDVRFFGKVAVGEPLALLVAMSGAYAAGTPMEARIVLPPGVDLVRGELFRSTTSGSPEKPWAIVVRPTRAGPHRIVARFVGTVSERERDEGDFVLVLHPGADTDGGISQRTRTEKVIGGRRYRYGGDFLVPIGGPEDFNQNDIHKSGQQARPISKTEASCDACGKASPAAVDFVVFLDKTGRLVDARPLRLSAGDPAVAAAAKALAKWRFQPSRLAGRPVADWLVVKVALNSSR
jgi:hypothetical protein